MKLNLVHHLALVHIGFTLATIGCKSEQRASSETLPLEALLEDNVDEIRTYIQAALKSEDDIDRIEFLDPIQNEKIPIIHAAAKYDAVAIMEWLIEEGANPDFLDSDGNLPGETAARYESTKTLEFLKRDPIEFNDDTIYEFLSTDRFFRDRSPIRKINDTYYSNAKQNFRELRWEKKNGVVFISGSITVSGSLAGSFSGRISDLSGYWRYDPGSVSIR